MNKQNKHASSNLPELLPGDRWIDDHELKTRFYISKDTEEEWQNEGLPRYSVRKKTYYKASELNAFLEKHRIPKLKSE